MELFDPKKLNINFAKTFKFFVITSLTISVASILGVFYPGLNYGIDFRGGIEAHVEFDNPSVTTEELRGLLGDKLKNLSIVEIQAKESKKGFYLNTQEDNVGAGSAKIKELLETKYSGAYRVTKMDSVGPKIGAELRKSAILALFFTCILIAIYIYWRFDARYSPGALIAVLHDLALTTGFLIVTGMEFSTTVVAALLTLAGYSINDTVVVFDRIRELEPKYGNAADKRPMLNLAINSTLSRTVMTAGTTLAACVILYLVGGDSLREFSATLFFGIVAGTYSSIFIAAPTYIIRR